MTTSFDPMIVATIVVAPMKGPLRDPANSSKEIFVSIVPISPRVLHVLCQIVQEMFEPHARCFVCVVVVPIAAL
jgi:hypothetical protein